MQQPEAGAVLPVAADASLAEALRAQAEAGSTNRPLVDELWDTLQTNHPAERIARWQVLIGAMRGEDGPAIRELFRVADKEGRWFVPEWNDFWVQFGLVDGEGAMEELTSDPEAMTRRNFTEAMSSWAHVDPSAATAWLAGFPADDPNWGAAYLGLVSGFAANDLDAATGLALDIGAEQHDTLSGAFDMLAEAAVQQAGIEGVTSWVASVPDEHARSLAFHHAANRVGRAGTGHFSDWLTEQSKAAHRADRVYQKHARALADADVAEALEWVVGLAPSPHTGELTGLGEVVGVARDQGALAVASQWLAENPGHPAAGKLAGLLAE